MRTTSFCKKVKDELSQINVKKKCCRMSLYIGINYFPTSTDLETMTELSSHLKKEFGLIPIPSSIVSEFKCEECQRLFLRGVFLNYGSLSDINYRSYQAEMSLPDGYDVELIKGILSNYGLNPKLTFRSGRTVVYFRGNEEITDFLNVIGAYKVSDLFVNEKIKRGFESDANRIANCDFANIQRAVSCASSQYNAIKYMADTGIINSLSETLKETAFLRLENRDASLLELAEKHSPPITKSGVNHRLSRIMEVYNKCKKG